MRRVVIAWPLVAVMLASALSGCAPRADRDALSRRAALALNSDLEAAWVAGVQAYGERLFGGRGGCATCHRIDDAGTRFTGPNLGVDPLCASEPAALTGRDPVACRPVAERVATRRPGLSALEYVVESILDPDRVVTPTFAPKVMKRLDEPPVSLDDEEILALAAFVLGGDCPQSAVVLAAAREFMEPCRAQRDRRLGELPPGRGGGLSAP